MIDRIVRGAGAMREPARWAEGLVTARVSEDWLSEAGRVQEAWLALGRQLAGCRKAAGLTQVRLAALAGYSRSTVGTVETGRQRTGREFWARCDQVLGSGGTLCRSSPTSRASSSPSTRDLLRRRGIRA